MHDSTVIQDIPLESIDIFAHQSREDFADASLGNLAESIKQQGQLQPGVAWYDEGRKRYLLICGERRYRALKLAGHKTMALKVIRGNLTQGQLLAINISENLQRESLNAIERGRAFSRLMKLDGITAREVAAQLKLSDATVSRDLALLDLPVEFQERVASGAMPSSVGAALARLNDDELRGYLAAQYASGALSREGVAREVAKHRRGGRQGKPKPSKLPFRLGGASITVTSKQPLTWKELGELMDRLRREAKKVADSGSETDLARPLKAS